MITFLLILNLLATVLSAVWLTAILRIVQDHVEKKPS